MPQRESDPSNTTSPPRETDSADTGELERLFGAYRVALKECGLVAA